MDCRKILVVYILILFSAAATAGGKNSPLLVEAIRSDIESLIKKPTDCQYGAGKVRLDEANKLLLMIQEEPYDILKFTNKYQKLVSYKKFYKSMEAWSIYNIDDYRTFKLVHSNIDRHIKSLSLHYKNSLNISSEESSELAKKVIQKLLTEVLFAYDYLPITNNDVYLLRKAILENDDIDIITKFDDIKKLQNPFVSTEIIKPKTVYRGHFYPSPTENESMLSVAVEYPKALEHLLKLGMNPNHKNSFGKTPLMYAAQRNQLKSVEILLAYGSSVNDTTLTPYTSRCNSFYQLNQYNVSALHYAVRYASKEIISLLISNGASTNAISKLRKNTSTMPSGTPLNWFEFFNSTNDKFNENDASKMKEILMMTDKTELK